MTPTFTPKDLKRISAHLEMSVSEFKEKWLYYDKKEQRLDECKTTLPVS